MAKEHESNRLAWNEAAAYYRAGLNESLELLSKGGMSFCPPEYRYLERYRANLKTCIHLQCAGGTDSLSLMNYGANEVIGVDISEQMIEIARKKSDALKHNARWLVSDILQIPSSMNATADFVYTGKGAINWIMDIGAWARIIARLLKPGGVVYLFEGHPMTYCFDMQAKELKLDSNYKGYFSNDPYPKQGWPDSYVGKLKKSESEQAFKYERAWPVSSVIGGLLKAGLVLEEFQEHPDPFWVEFPNLPKALRQLFPNTYSVVARKPHESTPGAGPS
ncbi:MAG: class I SAM-dependent methyltransferase [Bdellovibrionales bacterium]